MCTPVDSARSASSATPPAPSNGRGPTRKAPMSWRITSSIARLPWVAVFLLLANTPAEAIQRTGFDHLTTGFELRDAHRDMACEYCHVNGVFKGTPRNCAGCHTIGGRISATSKPPDHLASDSNCALCHSGYNFAPIFRMDHTGAKG